VAEAFRLAGSWVKPRLKVMLLVVVLACSSAAALPQDKAGQIEGRITSPDMITPIPSVQVTLFGPNETAMPINRFHFTSCNSITRS